MNVEKINENNKLFKIKQDENSVWTIDFGERKNDEQIEIFDLYYLFKLKEDAAGKKFCITGRNTVLAYFAAGYYLSLWGAKEISVIIPCNGRPKVYNLLNETDLPKEVKPWLEIKGTSDLSIIKNSKDSQGRWGDDELERLNFPIKFPETLSDNVTITGAGAILMYTALGIAFGKYYPEKTAKLRIPKFPHDSVFKEDHIEKVPYHGDKNGIVIGILGDPCSGKSVFSRTLGYVLNTCQKKWSSTWLYDCDMASPTPEWYLKNAEKDSLESKMRVKLKTDWSTELEKKVADDLSIMRKQLDVLIADMPGGKHKKDGKKLPEDQKERIPAEGERAGMMKECDAFIVLCRGGEDKIFNAWEEALQQHGLEDRIIARINSYHNDEEVEKHDFRMDKVMRNESGLFCADIYNLDRKIPAEKCIPVMKEAVQELIAYLSYLPVARAARAATAQAFLTGVRGTR